MPHVTARNPTGRQDADTVVVVANGEADETDKTRGGDIGRNTSPALLNISGVNGSTARLMLIARDKAPSDDLDS